MIKIVFIIDGQPEINYNWPTVPRVGEHVKFNVFGKPRLAVVVDVVYWNRPEGDCRADVACETVVQ